MDKIVKANSTTPPKRNAGWVAFLSFDFLIDFCTIIRLSFSEIQHLRPERGRQDSENFYTHAKPPGIL